MSFFSFKSKEKVKVNSKEDAMLTTVSGIASDAAMRSLAESCGLAINSVSWEDTARSKGSCFGPNISDMTLVVAPKGICMPMIRKPNFADVTADLKIESFMVPVGNEAAVVTGKRIPLKEYLQNIALYTNNPEAKDLYDEKRDQVILSSAQFCVLPDDCKFGIQLFNYQSYGDNPAVLVLVVSQGGTSAQVVCGRNSVLYFNKNGRAFNFHAKRLSKDREEKGKSTTGAMDADEQERNALMVFQIPLKVARRSWDTLECANESCSYDMCASASVKESAKSKSKSKKKSLGIEDAVLSLGDDKGEFTGTRGSSGQYLKLERDTDYPIRCTLQFYQVTDSSCISARVFKHMGEKIDNVYRAAEASGSLVFSTGPASGATRKTEPVLHTAKATAQTLQGMDNAVNAPMFSAFSSHGSTTRDM
jgi:hypothetical protein